MRSEEYRSSWRKRQGSSVGSLQRLTTQTARDPAGRLSRGTRREPLDARVERMPALIP